MTIAPSCWQSLFVPPADMHLLNVPDILEATMKKQTRKNIKTIWLLTATVGVYCATSSLPPQFLVQIRTAGVTVLEGGVLGGDVVLQVEILDNPSLSGVFSVHTVGDSLQLAHSGTQLSDFQPPELRAVNRCH